MYRLAGCTPLVELRVRFGLNLTVPVRAECINTFDAHEDKVWAMALGSPSGSVFASGGGDGAIALWEDCTTGDADEAAALAEHAVLKDQDLANALKV